MWCKLETAEYFTTCIAIFHLWNDLNLHDLFPLFFGPADARNKSKDPPCSESQPWWLGAFGRGRVISSSLSVCPKQPVLFLKSGRFCCSICKFTPNLAFLTNRIMFHSSLGHRFLANHFWAQVRLQISFFWNQGNMDVETLFHWRALRWHANNLKILIGLLIFIVYLLYNL